MVMAVSENPLKWISTYVQDYSPSMRIMVFINSFVDVLNVNTCPRTLES